MMSVCVCVLLCSSEASEADCLCGTSGFDGSSNYYHCSVSELGLSTGKIYSHLVPQLITCCMLLLCFIFRIVKPMALYFLCSFAAAVIMAVVHFVLRM